MIDRLSSAFCVIQLLISLFGAGGEPHSLSSEEINKGWILLWDGETTFGWEAHGGAEWRAVGGVLRASTGGDGWLRHKTPFANFVLKADFRMNSSETDSGIYMRSASEGDPNKTGYQVNINNLNKDWGTGSLVGRHKAKAVQASAKEWHQYVITADGEHITIALDGKTILDARDGSAAVGYIGLQYVRNADIEFRNIVLLPLGLKSIFNGNDLSGWEKVERPKARATPEWSVKEGSIHVEKGPGQLETVSTYGDFVLQLEARTNAQSEGHHPNSGVFFRAEKGKSWSGYESQIRNEYKDGDRAQPVDFGTGGLYHFQPARRVVSNDKEFFTKTIVAYRRHIAIWVNGFQTAAYDDSREEGTEATKTARLTPGPISLQAHDPTTNLDFRNIRIAPLPSR